MAKPTRIVGVDYGMARIGVSLSDESKILASPCQTISATKKSEENIRLFLQLLEEIRQEKNCEIEKIVIGMPLMMSGKMSMLGDEVKHFVSLLEQQIEIPIVTWDERLTSVQADRSMREGGFSRKKRAKNVDRVAAVIILQNYLDSIF